MISIIVSAPEGRLKVAQRYVIAGWAWSVLTSDLRLKQSKVCGVLDVMMRISKGGAHSEHTHTDKWEGREMSGTTRWTSA